MTKHEKQETEHRSAAGQASVSEAERAQGRQSALAPRRSRWSPLRPLFPYGRNVATTPLDLLNRINDDMDRLFSGLGGTPTTGRFGDLSSLMPLALADPGRTGFGTNAAPWGPQIELVNRANEFVVRADLPGLSPEDIQVSIDEGVLNISGERRQESRDESDGFVRTERSYGRFFRSIPLPDGADEGNVSATFRNGVLEVTVPTAAREQARQIQVKT